VLRLEQTAPSRFVLRGAATGAVLHTMNTRLSSDDVAYIVDDPQDRFVFVDSSRTR